MWPSVVASCCCRPRAAAAGAPDLTWLVEAVLEEFLARRKGAETALPPGDAR